MFVPESSIVSVEWVHCQLRQMGTLLGYRKEVASFHCESMALQERFSVMWLKVPKSQLAYL